MRSRRVRVSVVAACAAAGLLAGCSAPGAQAPPAPAGSGAAAGSPPPPKQVGPPVLVVKIDNSPPARPPVGVAAANSVYVEPVEGGLSRVAAVFSDRKPPVVGPVRSARETDLSLLPQFGHPTLAFSGAAPELLPLIDRASLQNASADLMPGSYYRDPGRKAPHNLLARTDKLPVGGGWPPQSQPDFGPAPAGGGAAGGHQEVRYPQAAIGFDWSPQQRQWLVSMDGKPYAAQDTGRVGASTVVLQQVPIRDSAFHDVVGSPSPLAETVGSGNATVLRDGRAYPAHWSRPSPQAGTTYTTPDGAPLPFAQGQVWTVLTPAGR